MTSVANSVPYEIWELVASHIPAAERLELISVCRCFLSIVLHQRYGDIRWTVLNKEMVRYLERLQEPFIAQHVQKLHIQAWFINFLMRRTELFHKSKKVTSKLNLKSLKIPKPTTLGSHFRFISGRSSTSNKVPQVSVSSRKKKDPSLLSPTQVLGLMINALSNMTNLTSYSFEWRDLPLDKDSKVFLTTAQNSARRLRKLVLHAQLPNFRHLLKFVDFEYLEELKFHFDYETHADKNSTDGSDTEKGSKASADTLTTDIAPFINRFTPSLHSLTISSTSTTPLTKLFDALALFPNLRYFELNTKFDKSIFPSVESLLHFLTTHSSSLLHVKFIPPYQRVLSTDFEAVENAKTAAWLNMNKSLQPSPPSVLSCLETLYLPASAPLEVTLMLLRRSANTLVDLCLSGRYLSLQELNRVLDVFSGRPLYSSLQYFRVEVDDLYLDVLAAIATRFPYLNRLTVVTKKPLVPSLWNEPFSFPSSVILAPEDPSRVRPKTIAVLADWKLCDLGVYFERFQTASFVTSFDEHTVMGAVRKFVPSIRYFKGRDPSE